MSAGARYALRAACALLSWSAACAQPPTPPPAQERARAEQAQGFRTLAPPEGDPRHGEYLATIGACAECHTLRAPDGTLDRGRLFAGGIPLQGPWGIVETANVSMVAAKMPPSVLEDMIRGRLSYKFQMPTDLYAKMAQDDMRDLLAYLRTLSPHPRTPGTETRYDPSFVVPAPIARVPVPEHAPRGATIERGRYLATIAICKDCHSPRAPDGIHYDEGHLFAGGGFAFKREDGDWLIPPNLTPDAETGIGTWTAADIKRALRSGAAKDGHTLNPAMPYGVALYALTDEDADAIVLFLKSLKPLRRALPENHHWAPGDAPESCCFPAPRTGLEEP